MWILKSPRIWTGAVLDRMTGGQEYLKEMRGVV